MRFVLRLAIISLVVVPIPTAEAAIAAKHAASPKPVGPGPVLERAFALTALQHLTGPGQRPFLNLLKSLPSAKQVGVTISGKATKNMSCAGGVCTPTATIANLNVSDVTRLLGDGALTIATTAQAPDIFVNAPFSWVSGNGLTLQAIGNIVVNKAVSDSGPAPLTLTYNANGGGGALSFDDKGHIGFLSTGNALTINGQGYILANNIQSLAQFIARNPSGSFALSANYNAKHDGRYTQSPIPTVFQGSLEGLGNSITGLRMRSENGDQPNGFFAQTSNTAFIGNFSVIGKLEFAPGPYIGGLVGLNKGNLFQANFDGSIDVKRSNCSQVIRVGGVAGESDGTISFSRATGSISTADGMSCSSVFAGGLVGFSTAAVDHSWAGASVTVHTWAYHAVGGLIGWTQGPVDQVFAVGPVDIYYQEDNSDVGGLVAALAAPLSHSSASGTVSALNSSFTYVGGLVGDMYGGSVEDGVATGAVSGNNCACGGAIGYGFNVYDATSYGLVSGDFLGGFIGKDDTVGDLSNDGWCTTSSGITDPSQGAGNIPNDPGITPFTC